MGMSLYFFCHAEGRHRYYFSSVIVGMVCVCVCVCLVVCLVVVGGGGAVGATFGSALFF